MKQYIVGGAVRDQILGRKPRDYDYVWVGATVQDMLDKGFKQVGADFPVFLDPIDGSEHALARKERKTGAGYSGFETSFETSVTLEDDLFRRDLTINAMALDPVTDKIIDPFGGTMDIFDRKLRHVSPAFAEDPLRVLRVARFAARLNFDVVDETLELMTTLVDSGEVDHLTKERVWTEMTRAIMEDYPEEFFGVLEDCGAEERVLGITHNKGDYDLRTCCQALSQAAKFQMNEWQRWVAFFDWVALEDVGRLTNLWNMPNLLQRRVMIAAHICELWRGIGSKTESEIAETIFKKFRMNQEVSRQDLAEAVQTLIFCNEMSKNLGQKIIQSMKEATSIPVPNDVTGKLLGDMLKTERSKIFAKYFYHGRERRSSNKST